MKIVKWLFGYLASGFYKLGRQEYNVRRYKSYRRKYSLAGSFRFNGFDILLYGEGKIVIGDNSYIGAGSTLQSAKSFQITIGSNCRISHNVRIYTTTNESDQDFNCSLLRKRNGSVQIGDGVWVGANVFINPGVSIGTNSIIGANSVVTRDVPPNSIVGGVPSKLIRFKNIEQI